MRDKKKGNRILICGIVLSICLFVLAGSVILHLSETFIRNGIADMAGAMGIARNSLAVSCTYTSLAMALRVRGKKS